MLRFLFTLLGLWGCALAQEFRVAWSEGHPTHEYEKFLGLYAANDTTNLVLFDIGSGSYKLDVLDSLFIKKSEAKIKPACEKIIHIDLLGDRLVFYGFNYNESLNQDELLAIQTTQLGNLSSVTLLHKSTPEGEKHNQYHVAVSPDKSKIAVLHEWPIVNQTQEEKVSFLEFDNSFNLVRSKEYQFPFIARRPSVNFPVINDNGTFFLLQRVRLKAINQYFIYLFKEGGNIFQNEITLSGGMRISDMTYTLDENGKLVIAGYSTREKNGAFQGAYCRAYGNSIIHDYAKEYILPDANWQDLRSNKDIRENGTGLPGFRITGLIARNDDVYLTAGTFNKLKESEKTGVSNVGELVTKFTKNGYLVWSVAVPYHQKDFVDSTYWLGSVKLIKENRISFFYNQIGYFNKKDDNDYGDNVLMGTRIAQITENGSLLNAPLKNLYADLDEPVNIRPIIKSYWENPQLIYAENLQKNRYYFLRFTLK